MTVVNRLRRLHGMFMECLFETNSFITLFGAHSNPHSNLYFLGATLHQNCRLLTHSLSHPPSLDGFDCSTRFQEFKSVWASPGMAFFGFRHFDP